MYFNNYRKIYGAALALFFSAVCLPAHAETDQQWNGDADSNFETLFAEYAGQTSSLRLDQLMLHHVPVIARKSDVLVALKRQNYDISSFDATRNLKQNTLQPNSLLRYERYIRSHEADDLEDIAGIVIPMTDRAEDPQIMAFIEEIDLLNMNDGVTRSRQSVQATIARLGNYYAHKRAPFEGQKGENAITDAYMWVEDPERVDIDNCKVLDYANAFLSWNELQPGACGSFYIVVTAIYPDDNQADTLVTIIGDDRLIPKVTEITTTAPISQQDPTNPFSNYLGQTDAIDPALFTWHDVTLDQYPVDVLDKLTIDGYETQSSSMIEIGAYFQFNDTDILKGHFYPAYDPQSNLLNMAGFITTAPNEDIAPKLITILEEIDLVGVDDGVEQSNKVVQSAIETFGNYYAHYSGQLIGEHGEPARTDTYIWLADPETADKQNCIIMNDGNNLPDWSQMKSGACGLFKIIRTAIYEDRNTAESLLYIIGDDRRIPE